jgi:hypothetical protein
MDTLRVCIQGVCEKIYADNGCSDESFERRNAQWNDSLETKLREIPEQIVQSLRSGMCEQG